MKKERKDESFLKKPWFKGGQKALNEVISSNLKYPKAAQEEMKEGIVNLRVEIDYEGRVVDAKVMSGIGFGCDEEAIRVVKLLKFEVAKTPRKLKVVFHKNLNIHFKLPKIQEKKGNLPVSSNTQVNYTYIQRPLVNRNKSENIENPKKIFYTINIK